MKVIKIIQGVTRTNLTIFRLSKTLFRLKTRIDQELDFYFFFLIIIELYDFRFRPYNFPSPGKSLTHTLKTLNYTAFVEKYFPRTTGKEYVDFILILHEIDRGLR